MRVLVLGGTGAMGMPLIEILSNRGEQVFVTSRYQHGSAEDIHYLRGNAHDENFLSEILKQKYDTIVDFMIYRSDEFASRVNSLLESTDQYIFTSSSRVYADSESPITECSSRLLDVSNDDTFLATDEYALAKARQENLLFNSGSSNWTVIRPYITYNVERLQLGTIEKNVWLYRALHGRNVPLPKDVACHQTTMTCGGDVAQAIADLVGNKRAYGEVLNLTGTQHMEWWEVWKIYSRVLQEHAGITSKLYQPEDSSGICKVMENEYQVRYDRLFDRTFDNSKLLSICPDLSFVSMEEGLTMCLRKFIKKPSWKGTFGCGVEAYLNRQTGEKTKLSELDSIATKLRYLGYRWMPGIVNILKGR